MEESSEKMRADGAGEGDIYRICAKIFSPEEASHLATVDQGTINWQNRIGSCQVERNALIGNAALSDADRQTALQQLRNARFSSDEQRRLAAHE